MSRRPRIAALALALAGVGGLAAVPFSTPPAAQAAPVRAGGAADYTFVKECLTDEVRQAPRTFTTACADGSTRLKALRWRHWGDARATAAGTMDVNTCRPSCADGRLRSYPVRVVVTRLQRGEAAQFYRSMTVTFTRTVPAGFDRTERVALVR